MLLMICNLNISQNQSQPYHGKQETFRGNVIFDAIIISKYFLFDGVFCVLVDSTV